MEGTLKERVWGALKGRGRRGPEIECLGGTTEEEVAEALKREYGRDPERKSMGGALKEEVGGALITIQKWATVSSA